VRSICGRHWLCCDGLDVLFDILVLVLRTVCSCSVVVMVGWFGCAV